jgi:DNA-binding MarR family transcriptional regulator
MTELRHLFSELVRFQSELWNALDARLRAECDLPLSRFEPMQAIDRRGRCRVHDIAEELAITVGGTSKLVDRIEAVGLCRRHANPDDGRSSLIELTPAGRRLLTRAGVVLDDELATRLGAVVPARSLQQLATTLTTLRSAVRPAATATANDRTA